MDIETNSSAAKVCRLPGIWKATVVVMMMGSPVTGGDGRVAGTISRPDKEPWPELSAAEWTDAGLRSWSSSAAALRSG